MRKLFFLLFVAVLFAACEKKVTGKSYFSVVPEDASAIFSINPGQLIDKSGRQEIITSKVMKFLTTDLKSEILTDLFRGENDLKSLGIDIYSNIYGFTIGGPTPSLIGFVMKVSDLEKLKNIAERISQEQNIHPEFSEGFYKIAYGGGILWFNDQFLLLLHTIDYNINLQEYAATLVQQKQQDTRSLKFKEIAEGNSDFSFWISMDQFIDAENMKELEAWKDLFDTIPDLAFYTKLNFEKGAIKINSRHFTENKKLQEEIAQYRDISRKLNNQFMKYLPAGTLLYTAGNVSGKKYMEYVGKLHTDIDTTMAEVRETKNFFSSIDGEVLLAIPSLEIFGIPSLVFISEMDKTFTLDGLKTVIGQISSVVEDKEKGYYWMNTGNLGQMVYFGLRDQVFYITNDRILAEKIADKNRPAEKNTLEKAKFVSGIKNSYSGMAINLQDIVRLPVMVGLGGMLGNEGTMWLNFLAEFSYLELMATSSDEIAFNIYMTNKEKNSLEVIVDFVEKLPN